MLINPVRIGITGFPSRKSTFIEAFENILQT
jgi:putative protein kinase ArgK-like GTPase of G3E family